VDDNVLSQRLLAFDDLRALYLDTLDRCARAAEEDGWLLAEVTRSASLVDAAAREDTRKLFANDAFRCRRGVHERVCGGPSRVRRGRDRTGEGHRPLSR
jgi:hypothetical protein